MKLKFSSRVFCLLNGFHVQKNDFFFRSRRPEAKPSTSLVLQLMDFEDNLAKNCKEPQKTSLLKSPLTADWKAKIKIALPLLIYSLIVLLLFKVIYEILSESSIFVDENLDDELVCF